MFVYQSSIKTLTMDEVITKQTVDDTIWLAIVVHMRKDGKIDPSNIKGLLSEKNMSWVQWEISIQELIQDYTKKCVDLARVSGSHRK